MGSIGRKPESRETQILEASRAELAERIRGAAAGPGAAAPRPGLYLYYHECPTKPAQAVYEPAVCVIAQGAKEVLLGGRRYRYDSAHYLITSVELPVTVRITEASPEKPYLGLRLDLDRELISEVMAESDHPAPRGAASMNAMNVSALDAGLLDALTRLVRLLDSPGEFHFLSSLITREIIYRLLMGEQGGRLRQAAVMGGRAHHIARAIELLRQNFDQPLRIENVARKLGMSASSFHHQFKAATAMSPLQFQKKLRLHEARSLMLSQGLDAAQAGFRVGYEDASHFSRDYKRMFGEPPLRSVELLRATLEQNAPQALAEP